MQNDNQHDNNKSIKAKLVVVDNPGALLFACVYSRQNLKLISQLIAKSFFTECVSFQQGAALRHLFTPDLGATRPHFSGKKSLDRMGHQHTNLLFNAMTLTPTFPKTLIPHLHVSPILH